MVADCTKKEEDRENWRFNLKTAHDDINFCRLKPCFFVRWGMGFKQGNRSPLSQVASLTDRHLAILMSVLVCVSDWLGSATSLDAGVVTRTQEDF